MWIDLDLVGFPSCGYAKIVQWWLELFILRKVVIYEAKDGKYGEDGSEAV